MNVIVANEKQSQLAKLDVDIIKSINGVYEANEIIEMFKTFFYSKMILDVTALKNNTNINSYKVLVQGLDPEKIIFLLPENTKLCTPSFLSNLISLGIYNFTTNLNGIKYLLKKTNTLKDVEHIKDMAHTVESNDTGAIVTSANTLSDKSVIIGIKNVTGHAGATTFTYMLKKELSYLFGEKSVVAIEIDKNDFEYFNDKNMLSVKQNDLRATLSKLSSTRFVLIDLNSYTETSMCEEVIYLLEPSVIKLNKLVRSNKTIFNKLKDKKVVLNKSLLLNNDVLDFQKEAGISVFYNMPPLDDRKRNAIINDFLSKLGLIQTGDQKNNSNSIFGLFKH